MDGLNIAVLGSGTCVPSLRRSSCALYCGSGNSGLVFDLGPGTMRRLTHIDVSIFAITHIFLSHFHPDHSAELAPFLFSTKYPGKFKRATPLTLITGKGGRAFYEALKSAYGRWIEPDEGGGLVIREMDTGKQDMLTFDDFTVRSAPMAHNPESLAYRITARNASNFVYSGDTDVNDNLIDLAFETDLLICESALPDALKVKGHLTPSQAGEIATRAQVRRLMLTHFYPECDDADIEAQCRKTYGGPLFLAEDLMRVKIP